MENINAQEYCISTMTPVQATERLRSFGMKIGVPALCLGIQQGKFPFGTHVVGEKDNIYWVYEKQLEEWIMERARPREV